MNDFSSKITVSGVIFNMKALKNFPQSPQIYAEDFAGETQRRCFLLREGTDLFKKDRFLYTLVQE